jgi:hypothetical protein
VYCMLCGVEVGPGGGACPRCGAPPATPGAEPEQVLYRCGPMGVGVSFARPGLWVWTQRNNTEVVVTDRRLCGVRTLPAWFFARRRKEAGKVVFNVPYAAVVAMERADYLANRALWLAYREGGATREVAIEAGLLWHDVVARLEELLRRLAPLPAPCAAPSPGMPPARP